MNILYISPHYENWGAERSLVALMDHMKQKRNRIMCIIPFHGAIEGLFNEKGIQYLVVKFYNWTNVGQGKRIFYGVGKELYNYFANIIITQKLKEMDFVPDIVHTNVISTDIGLNLAKHYKAKHVWHVREFGSLDFNMCFDMGDKYVSKKMHGSDLIITVSDSVKDHYLQYVSNDKIMCVYNGVPVADKIKHEWNNNTFRIVMVGRLSGEKGQSDAIYAIKDQIENDIKNVRLDIYGDGIDKPKLRSLIINLGLEEFVTLKGYNDNIDYSEYHLGLTCSRCEAFGRVTIEYMMAGLPVIGCDSGGTAELINDKVGLKYPYGDHKQLALLISKIGSDRNKCAQMGDEAYRYASQNFCVEKYCSTIEAVYSDITSF